MKSTGIVRVIDELGRVVLPIELRRLLEIEEKDPMEIFVDHDAKQIMFRKYQGQTCIFCQSIDAPIYFREKFICHSCLRDIQLQRNPELTMQEIAATSPTVMDKLDVGSKESPAADTPSKHGRRQNNARQRLIEVMETYPNGTQTEWAQLAGISQSRVSQIVREMKSTSPAEDS